MNKELDFMIVDDDPMNNLICKFMIQEVEKEAEIKIFTEPEKALEYINDEYLAPRERKTLLFLDINMPFMTGWEFLEEFKNFAAEIHQKFIIFILSSSIEDHDKEKANINPLVSGFLSKPININIIKQIITNMN